MRLRACLAGVALLGLACAPVAPTQGPARVSVRVEGGVGEPPWPPEAASPVHVVVDLTPSVGEASPADTSPEAAVRQLAARTLRGLTADRPTTLHLLGIATGASCTPAIPLGTPRDAKSPQALAALAEDLQAVSESSLGEALQAVALDLRRNVGGPGGRVIVISDFSTECGGDPCAAGQALADLGAEIDWVVVGARPVPSCLAAIGDDPPQVLLSAARPVEHMVRYRVERGVRRAPEGPGAGGQGVEEQVTIARGRGGETVTVPSGEATVVVDLQPPVVVGPLALQPGVETRIRVLDDPVADPPVREVFVDAQVTAPLPPVSSAP